MNYRDAGGKEALEILEDLQIMITDAKGAFGNRQYCQIDRDAALNLIGEIYDILPQDLDNANIIVRQSENIRYHAEEEADRIIADARMQAETLASEQEVVRIAQIQADEIIAEAEHYARDIREGANDFADEVFYHVERELDGWLGNVRANRERFVDVSEA